jgi:uncharacterized protein (DUF2267 family)
MRDYEVEALDSTMVNSELWLDDLMDELGTDSRNDAWEVLTAVLHGLRDRLPPEEVADLAIQLPMLVRGMFFDGWRPSPSAVGWSRAGFAAELETRVAADGHEASERCAVAVFRVLIHRVSPHEMSDVVAALPGEVRTLWDRAVY